MAVAFTLETLMTCIQTVRQTFSVEPSGIVMHPSQWRHIQAMQRYPGIFRRLVAREWRVFKAQFRPHWHSRAVQRAYVRHVEAVAWKQAQEEAENL